MLQDGGVLMGFNLRKRLAATIAERGEKYGDRNEYVNHLLILGLEKERELSKNHIRKRKQK